MPLIRVDSIDDERVAVYRDLPRGHLTRESGLFIAEGRLLVERLLASLYRTHSLLIDERRVSLLPENLADVPVFVAASELVDEIIGFNFHRGVLACGYRRSSPTLRSLPDRLGETALVLACVDVQDRTNLGSILRNCAAFGVAAVLLSRQCADPFARRVIRVSMGAALRLQIIESKDIADDLAELRADSGFELVATVLEGGERLESAPTAARTALMIGSEAHGLSDKVIDLADRRVTIPMSMETDSLNAAVASGVFLYHFTRVAKLA